MPIAETSFPIARQILARILQKKAGILKSSLRKFSSKNYMSLEKTCHIDNHFHLF